MPPITSQFTGNCIRCSHPLAPGALECDNCHALVHAQDLEQLSKEAKALESKGELLMARDRWLMGLPLLPRGSKQADWIQAHARELEAKTNAHLTPPPAENNWAKKAGPLGALGVLLLKAKAIWMFAFKLKFLLSLAAFIGVYWTLYGPKFGIGFAVLILIHEMGHFIDVKRRGLPAEMPVFLPGFGAYVKWQALGVPLETRAAVSLAGPLAGCIASAACALVWWKTSDPRLGSSGTIQCVAECVEPDSRLDARWRPGRAGPRKDRTLADRSRFPGPVVRAGRESIYLRRARRRIPRLHQRHAAAIQPRHSGLLHRGAHRPRPGDVDAARPGLWNAIKQLVFLRLRQEPITHSPHR